MRLPPSDDVERFAPFGEGVAPRSSSIRLVVGQGLVVTKNEALVLDELFVATVNQATGDTSSRRPGDDLPPISPGIECGAEAAVSIGEVPDPFPESRPSKIIIKIERRILCGSLRSGLAAGLGRHAVSMSRTSDNEELDLAHISSRDVLGGHHSDLSQFIQTCSDVFGRCVRVPEHRFVNNDGLHDGSFMWFARIGGGSSPPCSCGAESIPRGEGPEAFSGVTTAVRQKGLSPAVASGWGREDGPMPGPIVTITFNPALDLSSRTEAVRPQHKLRCSSPTFDAGGGGINVSRVCQRLGAETVAVTPLGGPVGQQLASLLDNEGIDVQVVPIGSDTRLSVTVTEDGHGDNYRFVFPGPALNDEEVESLLDAVGRAAANASSVVISGSFPPGRGGDLVEALVDRLPGVRLIVDTSGSALAAAVARGVFFVKPSARELAALVGRDLRTEGDIEAAADEVIASSDVGALLVSIGAGGAVLRTADVSARLRAPTVQVNSTVGAGDSMLAGVVVGLSRGLDLTNAAALGVAAGTAACLSAGTSLCEVADIERLLPLVVIEPGTPSG